MPSTSLRILFSCWGFPSTIVLFVPSKLQLPLLVVESGRGGCLTTPSSRISNFLSYFVRWWLSLTFTELPQVSLLTSRSRRSALRSCLLWWQAVRWVLASLADSLASTSPFQLLLTPSREQLLIAWVTVEIAHLAVSPPLCSGVSMITHLILLSYLQLDVQRFQRGAADFWKTKRRCQWVQLSSWNDLAVFIDLQSNFQQRGIYLQERVEFCEHLPVVILLSHESSLKISAFPGAESFWIPPAVDVARWVPTSLGHVLGLAVEKSLLVGMK